MFQHRQRRGQDAVGKTPKPRRRHAPELPSVLPPTAYKAEKVGGSRAHLGPVSRRPHNRQTRVTGQSSPEPKWKASAETGWLGLPLRSSIRAHVNRSMAAPVPSIDGSDLWDVNLYDPQFPLRLKD